MKVQMSHPHPGFGSWGKGSMAGVSGGRCKMVV